MVKMVTVHFAYSADIMVKVDEAGEPDVEQMKANLESFGARDIKLKFTPYTGAGEHEFVGSSDPGLAHMKICVKCGLRAEKAPATCAGIPA